VRYFLESETSNLKSEIWFCALSVLCGEIFHYPRLLCPMRNAEAISTTLPASIR